MKRKLIFLAAVALLASGAAAKDKNPDDYKTLFTVTAVSTGDSTTSHYCPMTVTDGHTVYVIYSQTWQCRSYPVGTQVGGRLVAQGFVLSVLPPVRADKMELTYLKKGKLKTGAYVVDTEAAVP